MISLKPARKTLKRTMVDRASNKLGAEIHIIWQPLLSTYLFTAEKEFLDGRRVFALNYDAGKGYPGHRELADFRRLCKSAFRRTEIKVTRLYRKLAESKKRRGVWRRKR